MDVADFIAEDFLDLVYGDRPGWIDLPAKVGAYWVPFHVEWPADAVVSRRIDTSLRDRENLYYSVAQFSQKGREIEHVLPSRWLWADLDEADPTSASELGILPTIAIESSPGRYQALWRLSRPLHPKPLERLNRGVSYALDADKGGWDLTQVLRIPGTRNYKYPDAPPVRLLWYNEALEYDPQYIWGQVKAHVPREELTRATSVVLPRRPIPRRAKVLLRAGVDEVVEGERSSKLWELECLLAEAGLSADEVFDLVWPSAWNKWKGVASGQTRLRRDIAKALRHVSGREAVRAQDDSSREEPRRGRDSEQVRDTDERTRGDQAGESADSDRGGAVSAALPFVRYGSFMAMSMEAPRWLVENIWTASSHGIIGGEPKTSKTTLALALSLAVASGRPFLGEHAVGVQGPVLMVQEENAPWMMQDRLRKLAAMYGLVSREDVRVSRAPSGGLGKTSVELELPADVPLKLLNNYGFDLSIEEHRDMLEAEVAALRPALVVLDPLYLIFGQGDENKSSDIRPYLKWLLALRYEYNTAVAVVHHFRKQSQGGVVVRSGQRVLGSTTFHGWVDSALYLSAKDDDRSGWTRAIVEPEFRSMAPQKPFELAWSMYDPGSLDMDVEIIRRNLEQLITDIVHEEPGVTANQVAERLGVDKRTILSRVRGNPEFEIVNGKAGRGRTTAIYPARNGDEPDE